MARSRHIRIRLIWTFVSCSCAYPTSVFNQDDDLIEVLGNNDLSADVFEMNHDKWDSEEFNSNVDWFDRLHRFVGKFNRNEKEKRKGFKYKTAFTVFEGRTEPNRFNHYDFNDWIVGFRNKHSLLEQMDINRKREANANLSDSEIINYYNYDILKKEYDDEVNQMAGTEKSSNKVKEAVKEAVEKKPLVCKSKDHDGLFIKGVRCLFMDYKEGKINFTTFINCAKRFIKFWLLVYVFIAIPCWCKYGWCFCYCRCRFCKPRVVINDAKRFVMQNPPGTLMKINKDRVTFKPTVMENYTYNHLHYAIKTL